MNPLFLGGVFSSKKTKKFLERVRKISKLSNEIGGKTKELETKEFEIIMESKDSFYISLSDIVDLIKVPNLKMSDILKKCIHSNDIHPENSSIIEIYAIPEKGGHLVLCSDVKSCDAHKGYNGNKIRITTVRR
jgi:hypothetical protein